MKIVAITQARMTSSRLPGKILMEIDGKSLLEMHLERLSRAKKIDKIILATTNLSSDDITKHLGKRLGYNVFRGDEHDVLDRFYSAAISSNLFPDYIVRITADCPLIDNQLIDDIIEYTITKDLDYCSNCLEPKYPDGQDVEVFKFECLKKAWEEATLLSEREHVTPYIWKNSTFKLGQMFKSENYSNSGKDYSNIRMTVDEEKDFKVIEILIEHLGVEKNWQDYAEYIIENNLYEINKNIIRNEGFIKSLKSD